MKHAIETKTTEDGIPYIGNRNQGCPHCGFVDVKIYPDGAAEPTMLYYHPGAQCCEARINDQLRWRYADKSKAQETVNRLRDQADDLQARAQYLTGKEKKDAELEIQKLQNQQTRAMVELRVTVREIDEQIAELKALL